MSLKIRLSRGGAKKRPFYKIVLADARSPRDGKFLERLGTYNPMVPQDHAERLVMKEERIKHWLSMGAQPTDRVARFFAQAGYIAAKPRPDQSKQGAPKAKAQERLKEQEKAREAAASAAAAAAEAAAAPAAEASAE
jgi:small subunit ribosomal protein S16